MRASWCMPFSTIIKSIKRAINRMVVIAVSGRRVRAGRPQLSSRAPVSGRLRRQPVLKNRAPLSQPNRTRRSHREEERAQLIVLVVGIHKAQQMQQAGKQVEDSDKQSDGRHNIIGFAAVNDFAGLVQNQAAHQQYEHG